MFNNIVSSTLLLSRLAMKFGGSVRMYHEDAWPAAATA